MQLIQYLYPDAKLVKKFEDKNMTPIFQLDSGSEELAETFKIEGIFDNSGKLNNNQAIICVDTDEGIMAIPTKIDVDLDEGPYDFVLEVDNPGTTDYNSKTAQYIGAVQDKIQDVYSQIAGVYMKRFKGVPRSIQIHVVLPKKGVSRILRVRAKEKNECGFVNLNPFPERPETESYTGKMSAYLVLSVSGLADDLRDSPVSHSEFERTRLTVWNHHTNKELNIELINCKLSSYPKPGDIAQSEDNSEQINQEQESVEERNSEDNRSNENIRPNNDNIVPGDLNSNKSKDKQEDKKAEWFCIHMIKSMWNHKNGFVVTMLKAIATAFVAIIGALIEAALRTILAVPYAFAGKNIYKGHNFNKER